MATHQQIAVIGSGYWGKNLVRNFHELGALRLIVDTNQCVLNAFKEHYPDVDTALAVTEALVRPDITGVVVATPAETHYGIAREALLAGKHVYVEKPLALDLEHARELAEIARQHSRILMVGHLIQYHPCFVKLKELAADGTFGRINYIYSNRLNLGKIRREENALWSFAPHDVSMILALANESPASVQAVGGNYLHQKIADVTMTNLAFPSGLKAHVFVSWLHPFKEQKLVVVGDRAMAVFNDTLAWDEKLQIYPHEIRWSNGVPNPAKAESQKVEVEPAEPLRRECSHFLECMASGNQPSTNGDEGVEVLRVLLHAQRSLEQNGAVLSLGSAAKGAVAPFVHDSAVVDMGAELSPGVKIWHFSHILPRTTIGPNSNIGQNCMIGPDVTVGAGCKIQNNVSIYKGVTLEDDVFCGPSMVFTNVYNPRAHIRRMDTLRTTLVRTGATLGANCTIVCGHSIGRYAFIGAGAVVISDVPDHALVVGNPARRIGWMCACGERLPDETNPKAHLHCDACGAAYRRGENGLVPMPGASTAEAVNFS